MKSGYGYEMNNDDMKIFKDTDLREALRRQYANTPAMPAGLKVSIMERSLIPPFFEQKPFV